MDLKQRLWFEVFTFLVLFMVCLFWFNMDWNMHTQAQPEEKKEGWDPLCTEN